MITAEVIMPETPWQLRLYSKSLKKKQKLRTLRKRVRDLEGKQCLLITCGDNNGAMNYHIREWGGKWVWAEMEETHIKTIESLVQEPVVKINPSADALPFPEQSFDYVLVIDCHEHLHDTKPFNREIARVMKAGGRVVVSVPNGDENKLAVRIKRLVGMNEKEYGHVVVGYEIAQMKEQVAEAGLAPGGSSSYSKFFTELLELCINFAYVKVFSKKSKAEVKEGTIAPTTEDQLKSIEKTYKMYSLVYPFFLLFSKLDSILFFTTGYAVVVDARKP
jgi:2-polyprenyl-3-methyl-5-hydroxy-6-metoxy-1,4-benzoquinol methylase